MLNIYNQNRDLSVSIYDNKDHQKMSPENNYHFHSTNVYAPSKVPFLSFLSKHIKSFLKIFKKSSPEVNKDRNLLRSLEKQKTQKKHSYSFFAFAHLYIQGLRIIPSGTIKHSNS